MGGLRGRCSFPIAGWGGGCCLLTLLWLLVFANVVFVVVVVVVVAFWRLSLLLLLAVVPVGDTLSVLVSVNIHGLGVASTRWCW